MRLKPEQLPAHLEAARFAPLYLLSGDEPLQMGEAADRIRAKARAQGYSDRQVFHVDAHFDWSQLFSASDSLSLFAERRLIELRITGNKLGDGTKALSEYAARPAEDTLLLVICGKLDKRQQQSKWFGAVDKAGVFVAVWPVERPALPDWIRRRMAARGLRPSVEAVNLLSERAEGNLLAAAQEIDKLVLLFGEGAVDGETVRTAVTDSSRYDIFELADTALAGEAHRLARILQGLRAEGVEPILALWALAREVRTLALIGAEVERGMGVEPAMAKHGVWEKRKHLVRGGLARHKGRSWRQMLRVSARIDRVVKGAESGDPWDELLQLGLAMAGAVDVR